MSHRVIHNRRYLGAPQTGDAMPSFELGDAEGRLVTSDELLQRGPLVLFFYPQDDSAGCTLEACGFRDAYGELRAAGATVVGISPDGAESHARFKDKHQLPYLLLSDREGEVARRFGVRTFLRLLPGRETFVIDGQGIVRAHLRSLSQPRRHVAMALAAVRRLTGGQTVEAPCAP
jgi:peroxiredoxin Q/BCP